METRLVWCLNQVSFVIYMYSLFGMVSVRTRSTAGASLQEVVSKRILLALNRLALSTLAREAETVDKSSSFCTLVAPLNPFCYFPTFWCARIRSRRLSLKVFWKSGMAVWCLTFTDFFFNNSNCIGAVPAAMEWLQDAERELFGQSICSDGRWSRKRPPRGFRPFLTLFSH